jgi:hypothetical protein
MISKFVFLAVFVLGLALGVYAMLHGIERASGRRAQPSAVFNTPIGAAFAVVFGATGYLLVTRTRLATIAVFIIAAIAASAITIGAITLISQWALPYAGRPAEDDSAQGVIALVTRSISPSAPGEISFDSNGIHHVLTAESIDGMEISRDTEVVIETIRDGIARVELWSTVEQRI